MNGYINKQDAIDVVQILQTKMSEEGSNALESVISAITDMVEADAVPISTLEQIKWERDCFEQQIREIGGEPFMKWECTDLAHIVRCKDCKESQAYPDKPFVVCHKHQSFNRPDWFCADGDEVSE